MLSVVLHSRHEEQKNMSVTMRSSRPKDVADAWNRGMSWLNPGGKATEKEVREARRKHNLCEECGGWNKEHAPDCPLLEENKKCQD